MNGTCKIRVLPDPKVNGINIIQLVDPNFNLDPISIGEVTEE